MNIITIMETENEIKRIRERLHLTQQELSEILEVSQPSIAAYETNVHKPSDKTAKALIMLAKAHRIGTSLERIRGIFD